MASAVNIRSYYECVGELLHCDQVTALREIRHHYVVTRYDHSVFVSYVAFRLARRLGLDCRAAARAGLLHDLFHFRLDDKSAYEGRGCEAHPVVALQNAAALCELTDHEADAILTHMWPVARGRPGCKLAVVVNLADKLCALSEVCRLYRLFVRRETVPCPA